MSKHRAAEIEYTAETGTCPAGCNNGFIPCPAHDVAINRFGDCDECDGESRVTCQDGWHD